MILNIKDPSRLFTDENAEKQKYMHTRQKWDWGRNTDYFFPWKDANLSNLADIVTELKPLSILDYGCGQGYALNKLANQFPNINFCNYDAFVEEHSTYPVAPCDLIVSNNVLHHIEDQFYDQVVVNLYNLCNHTVLIKLYLFENYKSAAWYEEKYSLLFKIDSLILGEPIEQEPDKACFLYGITSYTKTPLYLRLSK
jgi:2-polyprenyl-3-methyl-5-hydroxy-6-metoxy-1,4-benzoquinol methylase